MKLQLLLCASLFATVCFAQQPVPSTEVAALLNFAATCNQPPWNWNVSFPETVCHWYSVECSNGHIVGVSVATQPWLNCSLTDSLGDLPYLEILELINIGLHGTIPSSFANLSNLRVMSFYNNKLHGTIPSFIGSLSNLQRLDLSVNQFTGVLPQELGSLTNLGFLILNDNQLTGPLPESYSNLYQLAVLNLENNMLAGWLPQIWQLTMTNLATFHIMNNKIYGCIEYPNFPPLDIQEKCGVADNNLCCVPSFCTTPELESQYCLGSPSSVMIWMSQYVYKPNNVYSMDVENNNIFQTNMIEGDTNLYTTTLSCNDPEVVSRGVDVTINALSLPAGDWGIYREQLLFGDPSRWTFFSYETGFSVTGHVTCNPYLDTTNFTQAEQSFALGVSVWQGSLIFGVLNQRDVAGAWVSYAVPEGGGIVTSNDMYWIAPFEVLFQLGPNVEQ